MLKLYLLLRLRLQLELPKVTSRNFSDLRHSLATLRVDSGKEISMKDDKLRLLSVLSPSSPETLSRSLKFGQLPSSPPPTPAEFSTPKSPGVSAAAGGFVVVLPRGLLIGPAVEASTKAAAVDVDILIISSFSQPEFKGGVAVVVIGDDEVTSAGLPTAELFIPMPTDMKKILDNFHD